MEKILAWVADLDPRDGDATLRHSIWTRVPDEPWDVGPSISEIMDRQQKVPEDLQKRNKKIPLP